MGDKSSSRVSIVKNNLLTLLLRLGLIYLAYMMCRLVFYLLNLKTFGKISLNEWLDILKGGLLFDTSAIAYTNALFILLALLPIKSLLNNRAYQIIYDLLFWLVNGFCLILNVIDFYYFEFNLKRITADFTHWAGESNVKTILVSFVGQHPIGLILFLVAVYLLYKAYKKIPAYQTPVQNHGYFFLIHTVFLSVMVGLAIAGMRGGYKHSTRPITLSNAGKYVSRPDLMPIVLNTPFSLIRTFDKKAYSDQVYMTEVEAEKIFNPVKNYSDSIPFTPKNVVIIIIESFSREHSGRLNPAFDQGRYTGYTPFLDSLMDHSLVCTNAFANGRKSIDAMPSILSSIPSLVLPYVLSHNSLNKINSLASLLKPKGYSSAFYHGAPNGSMGFEAFSKIAGFDRYVGMNEYPEGQDYDGIWGIWDEEFLQFFAHQSDSMNQPFFNVCFTLSSHHPFQVPDRYTGQFPSGKLPVHASVGYTDMALRKYFETIKSKPWYANTLFVITADHSTSAWSPEYNTPVGAFSIPIIYFAPGDGLKKMDNRITQQTDIMPSILDYLHYDQPFIAFGNSIFDSTATSFALNYLNEQFQVIDNQGHLILFDGQKLQGVYDISKTWNLADKPWIDDPELIQRSLQLERSIIQQYNQRILHNQLTIQ